jgi:small GTP-binding protein domain
MDILIEGVPLKAKIWDTAGSEKYMALNRNFYRGALGAMIIFDLTREIGKENIEKWIKELREETKEDTCIILVGNKVDLNINPETTYFLREYAEDHSLRYFETSAKKGTGVDEAFEALFVDVKKKHIDTRGHIDNSSYSFKLSITQVDSGKSFPNCQC